MSRSITTLTMNPAIDVACVASKVAPQHEIRTRGERQDPGGGGVNVARVIHDLGGDVLAIVLLGGGTAPLYRELLVEHGVSHRVIPIAGRTRIALNVVEDGSGAEYRFVPEGPVVERGEWEAALDLVGTIGGDFVVASGSLPRGVPDDFYARLAHAVSRRGGRFVVDTSGPALREALEAGVALAKPSRRELEELVGRGPLDEAGLEAEALSLVRSGRAEMIVTSLGKDGALLATADGVTRHGVPEVSRRGCVGAGDSLVGAMTWSLARGDAREVAFAWGLAAASASTFADGTARPDPTRVNELFTRLHRLHSLGKAAP